TVANRDRAEIRQAGLRTDRREFGRGDRDFVTGKLIRPAFDTGQFNIDAGFGMLFGILGHRLSINKKAPGALLRPKGRSLVSFVTTIRCRDNQHPVRLGSIPRASFLPPAWSTTVPGWSKIG